MNTKGSVYLGKEGNNKLVGVLRCLVIKWILDIVLNVQNPNHT